MDQIKIGRFIAERRKKRLLTQQQLAEKLHITDRAVSKWECGKAMPDSSIMLELCEILEISVNDLLCGEVITMDQYNKKSESNLLEAVKQKEAADKRLLALELLICFIFIVVMLTLCAIASFAPIEDALRLALILIGLIPVLIATPFMIRIEQMAGYYECKKCGHRYVPIYKNVFFSMHCGTTRFMRCPNCKKLSWQKKVLERK